MSYVHLNIDTCIWPTPAGRKKLADSMTQPSRCGGKVYEATLHHEARMQESIRESLSASGGWGNRQLVGFVKHISRRLDGLDLPRIA